MVSLRRLTAAVASLLYVANPVAALQPITAVGSKFFNEDGSQFYIKGVAYQLLPKDPLVDTNQCQLDAKLMQELGANSIRVYHVDPSASHDGCMEAFANAGIYLWLDLDTFYTQIDQSGQPTWNQTQFGYFQKVLDNFQQYQNLAGLFIGNEVIRTTGGSPVAPLIKAAARDMKAYRDINKYRKIPVGYSAADIAELRPMLQNYLVCGGNQSETIDFFSLNSYEWCGSNTFKGSGYSLLQDQAKDYPVPIFFSETGCNIPLDQPRLFQDQASILGPDMDGTWSGAIIYEWIQESNGYGLVQFGTPTGNDFGRSGTPTPLQPGFNNLKSQWATLLPTGVKLSDYSASAAKLSTPACPSATPGGWQINGNPTVPPIGASVNTAHPTNIGGTGTPSTGTATAGSASATATKGAASPGREVTGMCAALGAVMMAFVVWL